ncbi:MAG: protein jag [Spirochaetes bacterium]|nr:MAG: protein jag [Spirochaetota bacterium]
MTPMEFEGRTEREAVAKAAAELGSESFDVEVLEKSGGLFGRSKVKIRVRALSAIPDPMASGDSSSAGNTKNKKRNNRPAQKENRPVERKKRVEEPEVDIDPPEEKVLKAVSAFVEGMIERMGYEATSVYNKSDGSKLIFEISSESSNILIGKKGKNLDALQLLTNVYLNRVAGDEAPWRIVLDTEGYRARREESLVKMAHRMADEAVRSHSSRLLEPMNPFERRLIHTAINDREDVVTKSEGDGLYKRVRVMAKGAQRGRSRARR